MQIETKTTFWGEALSLTCRTIQQYHIINYLQELTSEIFAGILMKFECKNACYAYAAIISIYHVIKLSIFFFSKKINISMNIENKIKMIIPEAKSSLKKIKTELSKLLQPEPPTVIVPQLVSIQNNRNQPNGNP